MNELLTQGPVLCGVDGSQSSWRAVRVARAMAQNLDVPLLLAHVLGNERRSMPDGRAMAEVEGADVAAEAAGHALIDELAAAAGGRVAMRRVVRFGNPASRLAALARADRAAVIVVGTGGRMALRDALLGSVSSHLAADAPCPVIVVSARAADPREADWLRAGEVVCGYDGSPSAWLAARAAAALATRLGGRLRLVAVSSGVAGLATVDLARALHGAGIEALGAHPRRRLRLEVCIEARRGDPAEQLEATAAAATAPLLVVGSRGLGPWRAALLGSVSRRLLQIARRPVMIVPATLNVGEAAA